MCRFKLIASIFIALAGQLQAQSTRPSADEPSAIKSALDEASRILQVADPMLNETATRLKGEQLARQALDLARQAYSQRPDLPRVRLAMVGCLDKFTFARFSLDSKGNIDEVLTLAAEIESLLEMIPEDTENKFVLMRLGFYRLQKAVDLRTADAAAAKDNEATALAHLQAAAAHLEHAAMLDALGLPSPRQAVHATTSTVAATSRIALIYDALAQCYIQLERWDAALDTLGCLQALEPFKPRSYELKAEVYGKQKNPARATVAVLQRALVANYDEADEAWNAFERAERDLNPAVVATRRGADALRDANINDPVVKEQLREALADLIRALKSESSEALAELMAAAATNRWGVPGAALESALQPQPRRNPPLPIYYKPPAASAPNRRD